MKKTGIWISTVTIFVILFFACQPVNSDLDASDVTLHVLNPRGEITLPPISSPSPRIP